MAAHFQKSGKAYGLPFWLPLPMKGISAQDAIGDIQEGEG